MKALVDGDILRYEIGYAAETGWQTEGEMPPFDYVEHLFNLRIQNICAETQAFEEPIIFISEGSNFRYDVAKKKAYKATRVSKKPYHFDNLTAYIKGQTNHLIATGIEADDLMCIVQCDNELVCGATPEIRWGNTIICSRDKDLKQCPGWHYGWELGRQPSFGPELVNGLGRFELIRTNNQPKIVATGLYSFYAQVLMGDVVDNIPGIKGFGPVAVEELFRGVGSEEELLSRVITAFHKEYGNEWETELLEQGKLCWMIRRLDGEGKPVMWRIGDME